MYRFGLSEFGENFLRGLVEEAVIKYYRWLLKTDFGNAGSLENSSIFVEAIGEKMINCGNTGNYMQLYLHVAGGRIDEMKYLCSCEPTANVAVEVLCTLVKGRTLEDASAVSEEAVYRFLGCSGEELKTKVRGLLELLNEGIAGYKARTSARGEPRGDGSMRKCE